MAELRSEFEENGFLVLPEVLSGAECEEFAGVLDQLDASAEFNTEQRPRKPGDALELRNCVARSDAFMELVDKPEVLEIVASLMGYNIQLGNSHGFIRPGRQQDDPRFGALNIGWHWDLPAVGVPINGRYPRFAVRVGYCFTDLQQPNEGSIYVVPGSHRSAGRPAWDRANDAPYGSHEVLVPAGAAIVFDNRIWHATAPNFSDRARKNLYLEYAPRWMRPFDYYFHADEVYERSSPVRKQLLGYDFSNIEEGGLGYQQGEDEIDMPLRAWLEERGITDVARDR
ncbi:MAG TPA: phytanoyl-CoA dioxygenase family protein [Solirubrobacterales bacterium]|nr:phytanoyl-CoA dioxygenase family protein [Solirubrobacterales bacterium]